MKQCVICDKAIEREDAPILAMSGYGNPKLLCDECAEDIEIVTSERDCEKIAEAMARLSEKMANFDPDSMTYAIVSGIMANAAERAKAIKDGTYDFALDEEEEESFDEIPEELLETEEDRELDARDEERQRKFDSVFNWVSFILITAAVLFVLYRLLDTYVF